jgi:hypothetical protein
MLGLLGDLLGYGGVASGTYNNEQVDADLDRRALRVTAG